MAGFLRSQGYEPVWKDWDPAYDGFGGGSEEPAEQGALAT